MPGLLNKEKWSALPLSVSDITSCVRGYTLAMTASLTYESIEDHAIEGHVVMDEDLERTVLVVNLGVIPPMETVSILVSTSSELSTLADGGIRVCSPPVCTPKVQRTVNEEQGLSPNFTRTLQNSTQLCLVSLLEEESINSMDYQFNFNLEIRAPYLLAGVESPSHAIRADADPLARSATSVVITLADKYTYDCPDAMVVILKSLVPGCLFNILGFGSTFKALFTTSQDYQEDTLAQACDYVRRVRADMGGTNLLSPLHWALRQPLRTGHPRLLFLLTDGAMIRSLKRAMMSPVLSDIAIEWLFPETKEVLLSPVSSSFLFPGDRLIGYSVVCDTTRYHPNPNTKRGYSVGLGRSQSGCMSQEVVADDPLPPNGEDGASPCTTPSSSGWERCSLAEASQRSPSVTSDQSQKSMEGLFSARA
ncbi:hypothetical protein CRUP_018750 [Coryphaenoides rupestris]|nr:hypothetical protein CRUP_018750 [Coryphaenoides rupestris]